jgi:hypothetical protein
MTGEPPGCTCDPPWPSLVVRDVDGDITVEPAATPGGLACLYWAYCACCGAIYPGPFRVPPTPQRRTGPSLPGIANACRPEQEAPEETNTPMTLHKEYASCAQPENQDPRGDGTRLTAPVPIRFPPELLEQPRRAADSVDRSLSWIGLAVEHELRRTA